MAKQATTVRSRQMRASCLWVGTVNQECFLHLKKIFNYIFKRFYLFTFREGKGRRKRRRETSVYEKYIDWLPLTHPLMGIWPGTQACTPNGNQTDDPLVHSVTLWPALNPLSYTSQGCFLHFKVVPCKSKKDNSLSYENYIKC